MYLLVLFTMLLCEHEFIVKNSEGLEVVDPGITSSHSSQLFHWDFRSSTVIWRGMMNIKPWKYGCVFIDSLWERKCNTVWFYFIALTLNVCRCVSTLSHFIKIKHFSIFNWRIQSRHYISWEVMTNNALQTLLYWPEWLQVASFHREFPPVPETRTLFFRNSGNRLLLIFQVTWHINTCYDQF